MDKAICLEPFPQTLEFLKRLREHLLPPSQLLLIAYGGLIESFQFIHKSGQKPRKKTLILKRPLCLFRKGVRRAKNLFEKENCSHLAYQHRQPLVECPPAFQIKGRMRHLAQNGLN